VLCNPRWVTEASPARVAVVGGGIAGLAAAQRLRERLGDRLDLVLVEQSTRLGGKLRTGELAGAVTESGAESFLVRDPDGGPSAAVRLAGQVGLAGALRHPAPVPAALALDGRLVPIPGGTLMGVPGDPAGLGEVAAASPGTDRDLGRPVLGADQDVAVGELVRGRFGDQVVDRLVDPLLGGVYAGHADALSLAVTVPALAEAARAERTLVAAVRTALERRPAVSGPVFATVEGGLSRLVDALAETVVRAGGARLRLGCPARQLERTPTGWRLVLGSTRDPQPVEVDAVVLAVPAAPAARLLAGVSPAAADPVGALDYASVGLVTLALPAGTPLPGLSGFLVPAGQGYAVKALTIFTTKWPHLDAGGPVMVRASVGRYGETGALQRDDEDLVRLVRDELSSLLGAVLPKAVLPKAGALPQPVAAVVNRWGGGLPQYRPGHLDRVAAARAALRGLPIALAGAAFDGVGIPACVRSGWTAGDAVADAWEKQTVPVPQEGLK
jgi:protoporphyrinogen/coproporphyrinogen III oxidase